MKKTRAVVLPEYNDNLLRAMLSLKVETREIPDLKKDEVLVKMEGAGCNPSDIAFLRGGYNVVKPLPCVPGFEGTGTVVETGKSVTELNGKRVSCFVQEDRDGTWAEYFIANGHDCILIEPGLPVDQASYLSINPITAWGMFEMAKAMNAKAFIQNAAGGQIARIMQVLADKHGVEVINLVRKSSLAEEMHKAGAKHVIDTSREDYYQEMEELSNQMNAKIAYDAVGGELSGQMINALPFGGTLVVYGALAGMPLGIDPMEIIFRGKNITGFNLNKWILDTSSEQFNTISKSVQKMIINGDLSTSVQGCFKIEDVVKGLRVYIKSMSSGKIIFSP